MKNSIEQNRKFKKQVSHLQSFVGMPMSSHHNPSLSDIRENDRRLLEKQALGFEPERKSLLYRLIIELMNVTSKGYKKITKPESDLTEKKRA